MTSMKLDRRERAPQNVDDLVDVLLLRDERWRDQRGVSGGLQMQAAVEQFLLERVAAPARRAIDGELDRPEHPISADIRDHRRALEREQAFQEIRRQLARVLEQRLLAIDVERGEACSARGRMAG